MGLIDSALYRRCAAEEETSPHVLCECEDSVTLRHTSLGSFFFDPQDVRTLHLGQSGNLLQEQGSHDGTSCQAAQRACQSLRASGPKKRARTR